MFAKFDEIPSMLLKVIKETKRYGHTFVGTVGRSDNVKLVYPPQTQFAGGIKIKQRWPDRCTTDTITIETCLPRAPNVSKNTNAKAHSVARMR